MFHTLYRLTTSFNRFDTFLVGVARLYEHSFGAEAVVLVCKWFPYSKFMRIKLKNKQITTKKGGISILTKIERSILEEDREIILNNRLIFPFIFSETIGGVYIKRRKAHFSDVEKKWFIAFSEQVSVAIKVIELFIEENRMVLNYIKSFSGFLAEYVPTSSIHYKGMVKLIRVLGKELGLSQKEIRSLEYATLLHDAGKVELPETLLRKQTPLTEDEVKVIRKHPLKGVQLIKDLGALKPVIPIILHHHERYDGKGYPSRLKKQQIPMGSRILAVMDAFDAMFFGRPYKEKMSLDDIERELRKQKGEQFDPKVVDKFLRILRKNSIRKHLNSLE